VSARKKKNRHLPVVIVGLSVSLVGVGAFALVRSFLNSAPGQPQTVVQEIHLIRPPPPPPDLPPPPPPPPEEKVNVPQPEKQPNPTPNNQPPPGEHLGLDAAGGAGSDAFGLYGNPGGRDLIGGAGGSAYVWYAGILKNDILNLLQDDPAIRKGSYAVSVKLWLRNDGTVERFRLAQSTGDRARDQELEKRLSELTRISQAPPADTPQPITVEITTRS
jgi:periplasmic protein TonB